MASNSLHSVAVNADPCPEQTGTEPTRRPSQLAVEPQYPLRAHDAWTLPVDVLENALGAETFERELHEDEQAVLIAHRGRLLTVTVPALPATSREHLIRLLFTQYIQHEWAAIVLDSELNMHVSDTLENAAPPHGRLAHITDVRTLHDGSVYAPLHGWQCDEAVITALRELITNSLNGVAEDVPHKAYPLPAGIGAAVAVGYDEHGAPRPLVWVRADLPSGLRADLWGYCAALATGTDCVDVEPDENGIYYVGTQRSAVTGPGLALLAAITVQRLGRHPEDCAFPLLSSPAQAEVPPPTAA